MYHRFQIQYEQLEEVFDAMVRFRWKWQARIGEEERMWLESIEGQMEQQLEQFRMLCFVLEKSIWRYEKVENYIESMQEQRKRAGTLVNCGTLSLGELGEWIAWVQGKEM